MFFYMMKTCKRQDLKQEYKNLLFDNFSELYQSMKNTGQIKEEVIDKLGFPVDTHSDDKEVKNQILSPKKQDTVPRFSVTICSVTF